MDSHLEDTGGQVIRPALAIISRDASADTAILEDRSNMLAFEREVLRKLGDRSVLGTCSKNQTWPTSRPVVVHQIEIPCSTERLEIWQSALPATHPDLLQAAAAVAITPGMIKATAEIAIARAGSSDRIALEDLREGLRIHMDQRLSDVANRITTTQRWRDLILPTDQLEQIAEIVARVKHRHVVMDEWGFGEKVGRGTGTAALMSGPPGTGKTMVAGLIARELGLDLYQIDVSKMVSKYIGETEKNLGIVFDAAESGHAVLLFDEADSLFGKRTEVKSSNDRYANQEVNYLLQRMEQFRGICILTTNHETAIDQAFRRRISSHVRFPAPDEAQRESLWRVMIPERATTGRDIDYPRLASQFEMTGEHIKNAVLRAAFLAADEESPICMSHLWRGARGEYEAMGKVAYQAA